jgi:ankyrin repeat protein
MNESIALIQKMIEHNANVNAVVLDYSPVMRAVTKEMELVVRVLLDHGADINYQTSNGMTAIGISTRRGLLSMTKLLLDYGADPMIPNQVDNCIFLAVRYHRLDILRLFRSRQLGSPVEWELGLELATSHRMYDIVAFIEDEALPPDVSLCRIC